MKICFPIQENLGLTSQVFGHFGSAPLFVVVHADNLPEFMPGHSCGGHGAGHSCSHHL